MITNTFRHLPGIGAVREQELWNQGIYSWDDLELAENRQLRLFSGHESDLMATLDLSRRAYEMKDVRFFSDRLPATEYYRIALSFPKDTIFLDIETTGLSRYYDDVTVIGSDIDRTYMTWIKGDCEDRIREALGTGKIIVTFNGSLFDLPFLKTKFPELPLPSCHLDLRYLSRRAGLIGPQKDIELELAVPRAESIELLRGEAAPLLWHDYCRGDIDALRLLITYNHADIQGMKFILDSCVERLFADGRLPPFLGNIQKFRSYRSLLEFSDEKKPEPRTVVLRPYSGSHGPRFHFHELDIRLAPTVVGIDLTGSEKRASGWCELKGNVVSSAVFKTDQEILERTISAKPTLVSIDSPLSLPEGRSSTEDDDPAREEAGITRACERELRARGVNVYPALIPSMQRLTERGIRLAEILRGQGIPVIESYPGAAQDILGIPRKGASIEYLFEGLNAFGLLGLENALAYSHDELDAITSAIVGLFFISGNFEGLGKESENYLIVPRLDTSRRWGERLIIGLSGQIASGKTTCARYLEHEHQFSYARYSHVIADIARAEGRPINRQSLQELGLLIHHHRGQHWLGKQLAARIPKEGNIVVDGMRHPADYAFLYETFGRDFIHVFVSTPAALRRVRYEATGEIGGFQVVSSHEVERNVEKMPKLAHFIMDNAQSIDYLYEKLDGLLERRT